MGIASPSDIRESTHRSARHQTLAVVSLLVEALVSLTKLFRSLQQPQVFLLIQRCGLDQSKSLHERLQCGGAGPRCTPRGRGVTHLLSSPCLVPEQHCLSQTEWLDCSFSVLIVLGTRRCKPMTAGFLGVRWVSSVLEQFYQYIC